MRADLPLDAGYLVDSPPNYVLCQSQVDFVRHQSVHADVNNAPSLRELVDLYLPRLSELLESGLPAPAMTAALALCREQGWGEVVEATAEVPAPGLRIEALPSRRVRVTAAGLLEWNLVVDGDALARKLVDVEPRDESPLMRALRHELTR